MKDLGGYAYIYRPQGCCMVIDLNKLHEVDYMDEYTFLYGEEIILAERFLCMGYRCACCLKSYIIHNHSKTIKSILDKKAIIKIQSNSFRYYLKRYRKFGIVKTFICCLFYKIKMWFIE